MKISDHIKIVLCGLGIAAGTTGWGLSPQQPVILYGTTTSLSPSSQFAITTTLPPDHNPRAQYVVAAKVNDAVNLEVLAWHDTGSSLVALSKVGIANHRATQTVAATGIDAHRVVTADVNEDGILSIHTWEVGPAGVTSLAGTATTASTAATNDVAIAAVDCGAVVTAYETPAGELVVEEWTIRPDGLPVAKAVIGKGPKVTEASIAVLSPKQVVTAAGDSSGSLWVNTWKVEGSGVKAIDEVQTKNATATECIVAARQQTVAVGAGTTLAASTSWPGYTIVKSAFTPVITPSCEMQVYYWDVSASGALTLQSTTTPQLPDDYGHVAATMLPSNIPITSYTGGTGDDNVFLQWFTGYELINTAVATYGDPYGALNVDSAAAGASVDLFRSLFEPYHAYFVSAGQFGPEEGSTDGTLFIKLLSYPEAPIF